jgi:hypothetical protein
VPVEDVPVEPSMSARPATPEPEPVWDEPEWLPPSPETWDPDQSQTSDWSAPAEPLYAEPERTPRYRLQPDPEPPQTSRRYRPTPEPVRPAAIEPDDFVIPPPLPEYRPTEVQTTRPYRERPRPRVEPRREQRPAARQDYIVADEFGDRPLFAADPDPLPEDVQLGTTYGHNDRSTFVSARLDRICQTCRDFRPSENGERGWCNNKWAFSHRRMVDADDLACRNSLGSWWTPKDEAWRRDFDISRHAQQTPRVDQWLLGNRENDVERRRSGS